jgi:hypothetical protein
VKHRFLHDSPAAEVFHDDSLQERGGHAGIPDALGIHDDDRSAGTNAEARRLSAFDTRRTEEKPFALQQAREERVERSAFAIRGAEAADADEHVARVRFHQRLALPRRKSGHDAKSSFADAFELRGGGCDRRTRGSGGRFAR